MCKHRAIDVNLLFIDNYLYAIGGDVMMPTPDSVGGPVATTMERLNLETKKWEIVTSFPHPRNGLSACAIDGVIYVFGGHQVSEGDVELSSWDGYDLKSKLWLSSDGKERRMPFDSLYGSACLLPNHPNHV
jgi:hypothetical protein